MNKFSFITFFISTMLAFYSCAATIDNSNEASCEDKELACVNADQSDYNANPDCSFDFGTCIAKRGIAKTKDDCKNNCSFVEYPKECQDECYSLIIKN